MMENTKSGYSVVLEAEKFSPEGDLLGRVVYAEYGIETKEQADALINSVVSDLVDGD